MQITCDKNVKQSSRSDSRSTSQANERMLTRESLQRSHTVLAVLYALFQNDEGCSNAATQR
jgi:hypothetical protein